MLRITFVMFQLTTSPLIRLDNGFFEGAVIGTSGLFRYWKVSATPGVDAQLAIHGTDNAFGLFWWQALSVVLASHAQWNWCRMLGNQGDGSKQYRTGQITVQVMLPSNLSRLGGSKYAGEDLPDLCADLE